MIGEEVADELPAQRDGDGLLITLGAAVALRDGLSIEKEADPVGGLSGRTGDIADHQALVESRAGRRVLSGDVTRFGVAVRRIAEHSIGTLAEIFMGDRSDLEHEIEKGAKSVGVG